MKLHLSSTIKRTLLGVALCVAMVPLAKLLINKPVAAAEHHDEWFDEVFLYI